MQKVRKLIGNHCFKNCWTDDITWTNWFRNFLRERCTQSKSSIHPMVWSLPFFHIFHWSSLFPAFVKDWTPVHVHLVDWELLESRESPSLFPVGKLPQGDPKIAENRQSQMGKVESNFVDIVDDIHTWNNWTTSFKLMFCLNNHFLM